MRAASGRQGRGGGAGSAEDGTDIRTLQEPLGHAGKEWLGLLGARQLVGSGSQGTTLLGSLGTYWGRRSRGSFRGASGFIYFAIGVS